MFCLLYFFVQILDSYECSEFYIVLDYLNVQVRKLDGDSIRKNRNNAADSVYLPFVFDFCGILGSTGSMLLV